jgi:cell division protein FtsI (penicillin-binding protein 3)
MLREVVVKGTGKRAQLNGYTSAGKTGTAWKYNAKLKKVDSGKYVSSFIGMAPMDNPSVVIAVVMDEPQGGARDGGQVSAPVFREIAEQILPELNVAPDANIRQETFTAEELPTEIEPDPTVKNTDVNTDAQNAPENLVINEKSGKKSADTEKVKQLKETKKENKTPDKKGTKQKTAALIFEIPKNKSSGAGKEEKT